MYQSKNICRNSLQCKASIGIALNPQDEASKARLSSLGQFRLTVKQLLQQKKAVPTSRHLGSCELAFQHLKHKSEEDNGSALRIRRKAWGQMRSFLHSNFAHLNNQQYTNIYVTTIKRHIWGEMFNPLHILFTAVQDQRDVCVRAGTFPLSRLSKSLHTAREKLGHF